MDTAVEGYKTVAKLVQSEIFNQRKTIGELAQVIGVHRQTASERLYGVRPFDLNEIELIAEWLDIPVEKLIASAFTEQVAA